MTETPPYLFLVTSTALVLGVAITLRGLWGFRTLPPDTGVLTSAADANGATDTSNVSAAVDATDTADAPDSTDPSDGRSAHTGTSAYRVRDLREPMVMTIVGVLICLFTVLGIAALVNSA